MTGQESHIVTLGSLELGKHVYDFQLDNAYFSQIENSELLGGEARVAVSLNLREYDFDLEMFFLNLEKLKEFSEHAKEQNDKFFCIKKTWN